MPSPARPRPLLCALLSSAALIGVALVPSAARAVDATKPAPCTGEALITDKAGDQSVDPTATGLFGSEGPTNTDIKRVWMNYNPDATGKPVLTANIEISNLNKDDFPSPVDSQGGVYYYLWFNVGATTYFVKSVNIDASTVTFQYGTIAPLGPLFTTYETDGDTPGKWFEGPDGVVQIDIPESTGAKPGTNLTGVMAMVDYIQGSDDSVGFNNHVDLAPDDAVAGDPTTGVPYTVTACPTTEAPTTPTTTPTTPTTPTTTTLPLSVTRVLDGAKKAKKRKALRLGVSTTDTITDLSLSLKKKSGKGPTYASAKAGTLSGSKTLKLKVRKPKKLKSGTYALLAKGTVNGAKLKATLLIKVKK
jgi:hypothetical protein